MLLDFTAKGTTNYSATIRIVDATDGTPEEGVVYNTAGLVLWYRRQGGTHADMTSTSSPATLVTQTESGTHTDYGFVHIEDGYYRLDLPDAALAAGVDHVDIGGVVTGMVVMGGRIRLTGMDLDNAVRGGMTALPNANAGAAGGLGTVDANNRVAGIQGTNNNTLDDIANASGQVSLPATEHTNIADELLKRDWNSVTGEAARSCLNAFRFLRNAWTVSGSPLTLSVKEEDDATEAWSSVVGTDASADPITSSDPT